MKNGIDVLLVDDQQLFVENLQIVLESRMPDIRIVGIAADGEAAVRLTETKRPDVILMDVRMPKMDGVEATKVIMKRHPSIKIIILTTFDDDAYVFRALHFGAVGYLLKNMPPEQLCSAVAAVKDGSSLIAPEIFRKVLEYQHHPALNTRDLDDRERHLRLLIGSLTAREKEILRMIASAYSNRDIGEKLGIAEQTVKNHLYTIYEKMEVTKRTQLMQWFHEFHIDRFL